MGKKKAKKIEAVVEAVKDVFRKEPEVMSDSEQKKVSASIRGESENLKNAIQGLRFKVNQPVDSEEKETISRGQLREYQEQLTLLCIKLDNARSTCTLDTRKMDKKMVELCGYLQKAISEGNADTVHYMVKTLCYGIGKGHEPLLPGQEENVEKILKKRENRLDTYINICNQCIEIDAKNASVTKNTADMEKLLEKRSTQMKDAKQFRKSHETAYQQIVKAGGRLSKLSGDALTLGSMMKAATHTHKTIEQIKKEVALSKTQLDMMEAAIDKLNIALNSHNIEIKKELTDFINQVSQQELERYTEEISWISTYDEALDSFHNAMETAFNTPSLKHFVTKALQQYEEMEEEIRKADEEYGRFLEEERLAQMELEQDEMENVSYN